MTKRHDAVRAIRDAIETGWYRPGQIVSQRQIMADLELSVTPTREALIELSVLGVLEANTHTNIRIAPIDAVRLQQAYDLRMQLETVAVAQAAKNIDAQTVERLVDLNAEIAFLGGSDKLDRINRLDREFHRTIFLQANDEPRFAAIEFTRNAFSFYALWRTSARVAQSVAEHESILAALRDHDGEAAAAAHIQHLKSGLAVALDNAPSDPDGCYGRAQTDV